MLTAFPGSPKLTKGAIVGIDLTSVIIFQYNPDSLTRTLTVQAADNLGDRSETLRLKGPPQETIKLDVEIDASDQLEKADATASSLGIYPALASLEMLLYPKSAVAIANEALAAAGVIEVLPLEAPLTLFVWGAKRTLPVRLTELTITEEAFDTALNPMRARVSLGMRVLTYQDLGLASVGGALFIAHQVAKEVMATIGSAGSLAGGLPPGST